MTRTASMKLEPGVAGPLKDFLTRYHGKASGWDIDEDEGQTVLIASGRFYDISRGFVKGFEAGRQQHVEA